MGYKSKTKEYLAWQLSPGIFWTTLLALRFRMKFGQHNLILLFLAVVVLTAGCETAGPSTASGTDSLDRKTGEALTGTDSIDGPLCIPKMREVARANEPFRASAWLPDFATTTDTLVEMSAELGRPLLASASTQVDGEPPHRHVFDR